MNLPNAERRRIRYLAIEQVAPGQVLETEARDMQLRVLLPAGSVLTEENIQQLRAHGAEVVCVGLPDHRTPSEVDEESRLAARDVLAVFRHADVSVPPMSLLFDRVLAYRSA